MIADSIKSLRQRKNLTQAGLAKKLNVTRSSVNAWELGISTPSTQIIVELASIFGVSSDFLLGINQHASIDVSGLSDNEIGILVELVNMFKDKETPDC